MLMKVGSCYNIWLLFDLYFYFFFLLEVRYVHGIFRRCCYWEYLNKVFPMLTIHFIVGLQVEV